MSRHLGEIALLVACLASGARAGELRLSNGAVIPGELQRIEAAQVVWKADLIGEIRVPKSAVSSFDTATELALQTAPGAPPRQRCGLGAKDAQEVALRCADGDSLTVPLASLREAPPDREDRGKLTVSLDLERGSNASEDQVDIDAHAMRRNGKRRHTFEGSVDYEQDAAGTTEDEAELLYQGDYLLRDGWFVYGLSEYRRDREASIQESLLLGGGAGYEFKPAPELSLRIEAGLNEVQFKLEERGEEVTEAGTVRWRGTWKTPWRGIEFAHEGNFGAVLEEFDVNLLETSSSLSMPIVGGWLGELRLDYDRYGISKEGGARTEIEWVFGLGYRW